MLASARVGKPARVMKVKGWDPFSAKRGTDAPDSAAATVPRRSAYVGTRKMVNYA